MTTAKEDPNVAGWLNINLKPLKTDLSTGEPEALNTGQNHRIGHVVLLYNKIAHQQLVTHYEVGMLNDTLDLSKLLPFIELEIVLDSPGTDDTDTTEDP